MIAFALIWQSTNNRTLTLYPNNDLSTFTQTDAFALGGLSNSSLKVTEENKLIMSCEIVKSDYAWPFCNVTINLKHSANNELPQGVDLSRFNQIKISAKYKNTPYMGLRVQLRNFNPAYSNLETQETWKFLTTEISIPESNNEYSVPLNALQVPNWWLKFNKVPISYSGPELDQIMVFELATGNGIPAGKYEIEIAKIELVGKYFGDREVLITIIIALVAIVLIYLTNNIRNYRATVSMQRRRVLELSERNKFLSLNNERLKDKVNIDALTGALNRHASEAIFPTLGFGDSVVIMDLDRFKSINDNFGHDVGDQVLLIFARTISNNLRKKDYFIRWGGEEFLIVCRETSILEAETIARKFRKQLKQAVWPQEMKVTCSFGVAEMSFGESIDMLLKRADSALYQAKQDGRDRINTS